MAKRAVADLHARLTADVTQYDAEMKRAAAVTARTVTDINSKVTKLQTDLQKKFSGSQFGRDILTGLGIGSGFAIAQTAAEQLTDHFRQQAEYAKDIEKSTAETLQSTLRMIALRQTDNQKRDVAAREFARIGRELEQAKNVDRRVFEVGRDFTVRERTRDFTGAELANIQRLTAEYQKAGEAVDKFDHATGEAEKKASTVALGEHAKRAARDLNILQSAIDKTRAAVDAHEADVDALAEKYKDLADPAREYRRELERIRELERMGKLSGIEAGGAIAATIAKHKPGPDFAAIKEIPPGLQQDTQDLSEAARDMGFAFSSAFEDAVIEGEKLGDVLRGLAKDILRMGLRLGVTNPLLNAVFGGTKGWQGLPTLFGFADGGNPPVGVPSVVGERGPELFVPKTAGTIIPNHALGGGGAPTLNLTYNFESGVTRQDVVGLIPQIVEITKRSVADAVSRGGSYRMSFA